MFRFLRNKYFWFTIVAIVIAVAWTGGAFLYKTTKKFNGEKAVWVLISTGSDDNDIMKALTDSLGTDYGKVVHEVWTTIKGRPERAAGAYLIYPGDRSLDVARRLRSTDQTPLKITFNNIRLLEQLAVRISDNFQFDDKDFLKACDKVLPSMGYDKNNYISAFLPDSYEFYWTAKPEEVVKRLAEYRNTFWNQERRAKAEALGLSPDGVSILASIVDEETSIADEKGTVGRLYMNRLEKGMKLQADPTVKFALGDFTLRRILQKHLETPSPYNTYLHEGLPPGPIRMPEKATIDAVLNAPKNNYLYMCAKEDFCGRHNFAVTLSEHNANARRYQTALNALGIR